MKKRNPKNKSIPPVPPIPPIPPQNTVTLLDLLGDQYNIDLRVKRRDNRLMIFNLLKMLPILLCLLFNLSSVGTEIFEEDSILWLRVGSIIAVVGIFVECFVRVVLKENVVPLPKPEEDISLTVLCFQFLWKVTFIPFTAWFPSTLLNTSYAVLWLFSISGFALCVDDILQMNLDLGVFEASMGMAVAIIFDLPTTLEILLAALAATILQFINA